MFAREVHVASADILTALRADLAIALLHRFAAEFFLTILHRPLLYGMVIGDVQMRGKLVGSEAGYDGDRHNAVMASYMGLLAERALLLGHGRIGVLPAWYPRRPARRRVRRAAVRPALIRARP